MLPVRELSCSQTIAYSKRMVLLFRTPDEDFGILLEAAVMYDRRVAALLNEDDLIGEDVLWKEI